MFDNEWVIDYSASEKITLSGIWLSENGKNFSYPVSEKFTTSDNDESLLSE